MIEQYRELRIDLDRDKFLELQQTLIDIRKSHWNFIGIRTLDFSQGGTSVSFAYRDGDLPNANLSVAWYDAHASIGNIVPLAFGQLTIGEYNALFMDFYETHLAPAAKHLGVLVELTSDQRDISDWISAGTKRKLDLFSRLANMGSGTSHPNDRARWLDFIVAVYREKAKLPDDVLQKWLVAELGWPETIASDLTNDFDKALELLQHYDSIR